MTGRYPELQGLHGADSTAVVLDGEIVALDADSKPDFAALWFLSRGSADRGGRLCFMAFDVLEVGDEALIDRPYRERRGILEDHSLSGPHWCTPNIHIGDGAVLFAATKAMGLEGSSPSVSTPVTSRVFSGAWTRRSTSRRGPSRCSAGFRRGSGVLTAAVWCWAFVPRGGSPCQASWSRAMAPISWSSCHALLAWNSERCSNLVTCGQERARSWVR